jgi:hypothetical protein
MLLIALHTNIKPKQIDIINNVNINATFITDHSAIFCLHINIQNITIINTPIKDNSIFKLILKNFFMILLDFKGE